MRIHDPDLLLLRSAARAAIVMPAVFAVRRQGDRESPAGDLRRVRLVRAARARRVRRACSKPAHRLRIARLRRRGQHHGRDALLAERLARGGGDGRRRVRDHLLGHHQRLLRSGDDRRTPDVHPLVDGAGSGAPCAGAARGMGARGRRVHRRAVPSLARAAAGVASRRRRARRRRSASSLPPSSLATRGRSPTAFRPPALR